MQRGYLVIVLAAGVLFAGSAAAQEIYRWIDRSGRVHFTDNLLSIPEEYRTQVESRPVTPPRQVETPSSSETPTPQSDRSDDAPRAPAPLPPPVRATLPPVPISHIQELRLALRNEGGQITGHLVFLNAQGQAVAIQDQAATLAIQCGRTELYNQTWTVHSGDFRYLQIGDKTILAVPLSPITSFGDQVCLGNFGEATVMVSALRATGQVALQGLF